MLSGHTRMDPGHWDETKKDFTDAWKYTVEDAAVAGQQYVISPWLDASLRKTYDDLLHYMDVFNKCGELCKKSGMKFGYHNHDFEFSTVLDNKKVFDIILQHTDPELVAQQLDMGNLYNGGAIAIAIVMQYPGRFELMHVKDEIKASAAPKNMKAPYWEKVSSIRGRWSTWAGNPGVPLISSSNRNPTRARRRLIAPRQTWLS
jgi:sugar phosphate isomerase/epimerase